MRKLLVALVALACLIGLAGPSFATFPRRGHEATTLVVDTASGGSGTAVLTTIWHSRKICFNITGTITSATDGSYEAEVWEGVKGTVAVLFQDKNSGQNTGCVGPWQIGGPNPVGVYVGRAELKKLIAHPDLFVVKLNSDAGRLQGTLHRGTTP